MKVAELYQQKGITAYEWFQDALPKIREIYPKVGRGSFCHMPVCL